MRFLALLLLSSLAAHAQPSPAIGPYASSIAEAFVKECPNDFKLVSKKKQQENVKISQEAFGKEDYTQHVKGTRERIRENGGCAFAVTDFKKRNSSQYSHISNMDLIKK